jgi:hypothetical protein
VIFGCFGGVDIWREGHEGDLDGIWKGLSRFNEVSIDNEGHGEGRSLIPSKSF